MGEENHVHFNTLNNNLERLSKALCYLPIEKKYNLFGYGERLVPAVDVISRKFNSPHTTNTVWYTASKELVEQFSTEYV